MIQTDQSTKAYTETMERVNSEFVKSMMAIRELSTTCALTPDQRQTVLKAILVLSKKMSVEVERMII